MAKHERLNRTTVYLYNTDDCVEVPCSIGDWAELKVPEHLLSQGDIERIDDYDDFLSTQNIKDENFPAKIHYIYELHGKKYITLIDADGEIICSIRAHYCAINRYA